MQYLYTNLSRKNKLKQDNNANKAVGKEGFLFTIAESVNWCCLMRLMGEGLRIIKMKPPYEPTVSFLGMDSKDSTPLTERHMHPCTLIICIIPRKWT